MTCPRCLGLIVPIASLLLEATAEYPYLASDRHEDRAGWRCVNCGNIEDPTIVVNRRRSGAVMEPRQEVSHVAA